ncbi:MAG TPA: hypothetical protein VF927_05075 [Solirubrobacteraceae bacterium]
MIRETKVAAAVALACAALGTMAFASLAAAAPPEIGRCVALEKTLGEGDKKPHYHGGYGNNCTKPNANHHGKYEWLPGPGPANHFFAIADEPEPVLETVGGAKIECTIMSWEGEYTGAKSLTISKFFLQGCTSNGKGCQQNPVKEGEIEVTGIEGELGPLKGPKGLEAAWVLKKSGTWQTFTCGTTEGPTIEQLEGSVIGVVTKGEGFGDLNKMSRESYINFKQTHGKQEPESFEGTPPNVLETLAIKLPGTQTEEQTGLSALVESGSGLGKPIEEEQNREKLEVRTKPEA